MFSQTKQHISRDGSRSTIRMSLQSASTSLLGKCILFAEIWRLQELHLRAFSVAEKLREFPDLIEFCWLLNTTQDQNHHKLDHQSSSAPPSNYMSTFMNWLTAKHRWRETSHQWSTQKTSNRNSLEDSLITLLIMSSLRIQSRPLTKQPCTENTMMTKLPLLTLKEFLAVLVVSFQTLMVWPRTLWEWLDSLTTSPIWREEISLIRETHGTWPCESTQNIGKIT